MTVQKKSSQWERFEKIKWIRIQNLDDEEEGAQHVNHIQHLYTPLPKEYYINVAITRSKTPHEFHPINDENSCEPSVEELR